MIRIIFLVTTLVYLLICYALSFTSPQVWWSLVIFGPLIVLGFLDMVQAKQSIRRNFPVLGHFRYLLEVIRPEIYQYFVESDTSGTPFTREERSVVYQRAKGVKDTIPFGTQKNVYNVGYEWVNHSVQPKKVDPTQMRITIGTEQCKQPYNASILNVSAMSFGSISKNAVLALNRGAKLGNFAQNTGEGGLSKYHLMGGGDLIWQIGTGYFGCRTAEGKFDPVQFKERSHHPNVKMIELKLSQGAKPGGGGILPGAKVSLEIAEARGVPVGKEVVSPAMHSTFHTPVEMLEFLAKLRELSGGKPVGFKLCIGKRSEFIAICKAMVKTGIIVDYIAVDGNEGGTGAAPLEFSNYLGCPLTEALIFVHNCLIGFSLRNKIRIFAAGKVTTGFGMIHRLAIGADAVYSARGMMMAMGCIQALKCDTNKCPVGIATQDPQLIVGLVVEEKYKRVAQFHQGTIKSFSQMIGAMGLEHPSQLRPWHILRRIDYTQIRNYGEIYEFLKDGELLSEPKASSFRRAWQLASAESFAHAS